MLGHSVEPADGFLGEQEEILFLIRDVHAAKGEFKEQDGGSLHQVVQDAPPGGNLIELNGVRLIWDQV